MRIRTFCACAKALFRLTRPIFCIGTCRSECVCKAHHFLQDCMCVQQRLRTACVSTYSKQNLCRPSEESLDAWLLFERKAMILISLHICAGWSELLLGGHAILWEMLCPGSVSMRYLFFSQRKVFDWQMWENRNPSYKLIQLQEFLRNIDQWNRFNVEIKITKLMAVLSCGTPEN